MPFIREELETKFREEYERLNEKQRLAVDTIDGPVMVIAGPGTCKTQILLV
ncbi:MAG TPA: UvrD-helicase domain-containing protein [Chitinophagaceae bacterium]|nr:UvrD-helicase domain-containing protein [Chitinophagaceae bacterium]